jgi:AraC-like DNA-binding protein
MTFADRVRAHLRDADLSRTSQQRIASTLHMSDTTLRRRLRNEGLSYQQLLDDERKRRTDECLDKWGNQAYGKRISDVCGYTELNSFYRAFRRWTGTDYLQARMQA